MDLTGIQSATKMVLTEIPELDAFIDKQRQAIGQTVTDSLNAALAGFADGLSQILQLGYSINGASVSLEVEPIVLPTIPAIRAKLTISMPLIPKS